MSAKCMECAFKQDIVGDCHVICRKKFDGEYPALNAYGVQEGWAMWPNNFDPTWVISCHAFVPKGSQEHKILIQREEHLREITETDMMVVRSGKHCIGKS